MTLRCYVKIVTTHLIYLLLDQVLFAKVLLKESFTESRLIMSSILSLLLCCFYPKTLNKSVFIEDTCESLTSDCKHESVHLDEEPIRRELEMLPYENDFSFVTETKDFDQMTSGDCEYFELLSRQV